jgi:hypothetical protein
LRHGRTIRPLNDSTNMIRNTFSTRRR